MSTVRVLADAPAANPDRNVPAVSRLFQGDHANIIAFNFLPGQQLQDHKAAHPIIVQALHGTLDFTCGDETVRLEPGVAVHLPAYVIHRVDCPEDASADGNVLMLTMLTAEKV
nr:cupin domain-containing protein [Corynebacterium durum]